MNTTESSIRTNLKTATLVREALLTMFDTLTDFESKVHSLEPDGPGVQDSIDWLEASKELLLDKLEALKESEREVYNELMGSMRKKDA